MTERPTETELEAKIEAVRKRFGYRSFWSVGGGSGDSIFWVPIYGGPEEAWWFKLIIQPIYNVAYRLDKALWWMLHRFHPEHRYHLIDTGLEPGWHDEDTLILHACFAMLCRYIEQMGGDKAILDFNAELRDPAHDPRAPEELKGGQADRQDEAVALYRYWTITRPADQKRERELLDLTFGDADPSMFHRVPDKYGHLHRKVLPERAEEWQALHDEHNELERKIYQDEQAMLHRLIDIRGSLWT